MYKILPKDLKRLTKKIDKVIALQKDIRKEEYDCPCYSLGNDLLANKLMVKACFFGDGCFFQELELTMSKNKKNNHFLNKGEFNALLFLASTKGNLSAIRWLVGSKDESGVPCVNYLADFHAYLVTAVKSGYLDIAKYLIDQRDKNGNRLVTPSLAGATEEAARCNQLSILKLLMSLPEVCETLGEKIQEFEEGNPIKARLTTLLEEKMGEISEALPQDEVCKEISSTVLSYLFSSSEKFSSAKEENAYFFKNIKSSENCSRAAKKTRNC